MNSVVKLCPISNDRLGVASEKFSKCLTAKVSIFRHVLVFLLLHLSMHYRKLRVIWQHYFFELTMATKYGRTGLSKIIEMQ